MGTLSEAVDVLRISVKHIDERTIRGETLMLAIQGEQHKQSKVLERIAHSLHVEEDVQIGPAHFVEKER